jgi:hypothetical protein
MGQQPVLYDLIAQAWETVRHGLKDLTGRFVQPGEGHNFSYRIGARPAEIIKAQVPHQRGCDFILIPESLYLYLPIKTYKQN